MKAKFFHLQGKKKRIPLVRVAVALLGRYALYRLQEKVYLNDGLIEGHQQVKADRWAVVPTIVQWNGIPSYTMLPVNLSARIIVWATNRSRPPGLKIVKESSAFVQPMMRPLPNGRIGRSPLYDNTKR